MRIGGVEQNRFIASSNLEIVDEGFKVKQGVRKLGETKEVLEKTTIGELRQALKDHRHGQSWPTAETPPVKHLVPKRINKMRLK